MKLGKKTNNETPQTAAKPAQAHGDGGRQAKNAGKPAPAARQKQAAPRKAAPKQNEARGLQQKQINNRQKPVPAKTEPAQETQAKAKNNAKSLKIRFLGGVGEIGKNMTAFEYGKDIIVVDAGLSFPSDDMPGIDLVIPDITYLEENKSRIKGIVLTHGHEDHIGGLPYLLKEISAPVFGTKLTLTLAENKLAEHRLNNVNLNCVKAGSVIKLGCFSVEFINVNHSIAGAVALAVTTPVGVVFHSGDYKIDFTPINGDYMDLTRIAEIGKKGVLLLMAESTNVERAGYTMSEKVVGETLDHVFGDNTDRRLIIATFASNVHRLQQILDLAVKYRRKVVFSGRSMINVAEAASKIGELKIPENIIVDVEKLKNFRDNEILIISTGSQGEPMSALTRMASGEFNKVTIGANDTIVISASPIPGNEKMIYGVINNLYRKGAEVIYESLEPIHVSGHACQGEIKVLHSLVKPKFFIPVHGEYRHLKKHARLAVEMGLKKSNVLIADIGNTVELTSKTMTFGENFPSGARLVDGLGIDGSESVVLKDRIHLSEDGLLVVVVGFSEEGRAVCTDIINRGILLDDKLMEEIRQNVNATLTHLDVKAGGDKAAVKNAVRRGIKNHLFRRTKKNPMILPIIMDI
ncbi:MAG: ribonuclease J [Bacillota bacterium]|nr:MAG: ribonuclease J [Bacillota bacterium]